MLHTIGFSLQNAVYFIMLPFFFFVFTFYIHGVLKFKCKIPVPKGQGSYKLNQLSWNMSVLYYSPASEFYMRTFRNTVFSIFIGKSVYSNYTPTCLWRWNSVPKRRHIKFRRRGITQKKHGKSLKSRMWKAHYNWICYTVRIGSRTDNPLSTV
jgi:hypothetical protein